MKQAPKVGPKILFEVLCEFVMDGSGRHSSDVPSCGSFLVRWALSCLEHFGANSLALKVTEMIRLCRFKKHFLGHFRA